jgi:hypothetical protein
VLRMPVMRQVQVVNLVSNDVRRFDDAGPFWVRTSDMPSSVADDSALLGIRALGHIII